MLYFGFYRKGKKYSMVVFPYFVGSIIITARWLVETGRMIIEKYATMGVYAILVGVIVIMSIIIFYTQERKEKLEQLMKREEATQQTPEQSSLE